MTRFIRFSYLLLFFLTPFLLSPTSSELFELPKMYFVYALTAIITTLHLINFIHGQTKLFRYTSLTIPLILFLVSQAISTYFSIDVHTSIFGYYSRFNGGLLSTISYLLLYFVIVNYLDDLFKKQIINISLLSGFFIALYGILEHFGIDKHFWVQDVQARVFSTLGQPNWLAAYLCLLLPLSLQKSFDLKHKNNYFTSTIYDLLTTILFICLLFTKSKSGIIAAIVSIAIFLFFHLVQNRKNKTQLVKFWPVLLLVFFSIVINNPIKDRLFPSKSTTHDLPSTILITPSEDIRQIVWQGAIDLWRKFPLIGTGTETFAYTYYWTRPASHNLTSEWDFLYNKAHNEYINFLATTGSFGFITYIFLILSILLIFLKTKHFALLASFVSILITNFSGFSVVITSLYFFLLPGLAIANSQDHPNHSKPKILIFPLVLSCYFILVNIINFIRADIHYNLSSSYENGQYYSEAYQQIAQSHHLFPDEPVYLVRLASISAKNALVAQKNKNQADTDKFLQIALSSTIKSTQLSPANVNYYKEQSQVYYYLSSIDKKYFPQALESIIKATKLAPTDAKSFYILGQFWQTIDKTDEAIKAYLAAMDLKPNYDHAAFALAQLYYQKKDYPNTKKYLEITLKFAPTNLDAQSLLKKLP